MARLPLSRVKRLASNQSPAWMCREENTASTCTWSICRHQEQPVYVSLARLNSSKLQEVRSAVHDSSHENISGDNDSLRDYSKIKLVSIGNSNSAIPTLVTRLVQVRWKSSNRLRFNMQKEQSSANVVICPGRTIETWYTWFVVLRYACILFGNDILAFRYRDK